jgi:hypothetical protein
VLAFANVTFNGGNPITNVDFGGAGSAPLIYGGNNVVFNMEGGTLTNLNGVTDMQFGDGSKVAMTNVTITGNNRGVQVGGGNPLFPSWGLHRVYHVPLEYQFSML